MIEPEPHGRVRFHAIADEMYGAGYCMPGPMREMRELFKQKADRADPNFESLDGVLPADQATGWLRRWAGNETLSADTLRIFGHDSEGGVAAIWLVRPGLALLDQPIVFFGAAGDCGVIAQDFAGFLCLLADGYGPFEAIMMMGADVPDRPKWRAFAIRHIGPGCISAVEAFNAAQAEFPYFESDIESLIGLSPRKLS